MNVKTTNKLLRNGKIFKYQTDQLISSPTLRRFVKINPSHYLLLKSSLLMS